MRLIHYTAVNSWALQGHACQVLISVALFFFFYICSIPTALRHTGLYSKHRCKNSKILFNKIKAAAVQTQFIQTWEKYQEIQKECFRHSFLLSHQLPFNNHCIEHTTRQPLLFFFSNTSEIKLQLVPPTGLIHMLAESLTSLLSWWHVQLFMQKFHPSVQIGCPGKKSSTWRMPLDLFPLYLCPCAAAWLKEFMSPCGVMEMPFLYIVPIMGSAPRSNSKLTSSKFPARQEVHFYFF